MRSSNEGIRCFVYLGFTRALAHVIRNFCFFHDLVKDLKVNLWHFLLIFVILLNKNLFLIFGLLNKLIWFNNLILFSFKMIFTVILILHLIHLISIFLHFIPTFITFLNLFFKLFINFIVFKIFILHCFYFIDFLVIFRNNLFILKIQLFWQELLMLL